jgi:hypothetical protein
MRADCFLHWLPFLRRKLKTKLSQFLEKHLLILKILPETLSEATGFRKLSIALKIVSKAACEAVILKIVPKAGTDMYLCCTPKKVNQLQNMKAGTEILMWLSEIF